MRAVFGAAIYNIWLARNHQVFHNDVVNTSFIVSQVKHVIRKTIDMFRHTKKGRKNSYGFQLLLTSYFLRSTCFKHPLKVD